MTTIKLTVTEISELQPTGVDYASERGTVIGGIEVSGDINADKVEAAREKYFGPASKLDESEAHDGDDCVHYIVLLK